MAKAFADRGFRSGSADAVAPLDSAIEDLAAGGRPGGGTPTQRSRLTTAWCSISTAPTRSRTGRPLRALLARS
jgi:hypothetical protein